MKGLGESMQEIQDKFRSNKFIPEKLIEYYQNCISKEVDNSLTKSIARNPDSTIDKIGKMFETAIKATQIEADELFRLTGIKRNDLGEERIDSSFAEIRTINYLYNQGYRDIKIIDDKKRRFSDIIASIREIKICFEVSAITNIGNPKWYHNDIKNSILTKLRKKGKIIQLENTKDEYNCDKMCFVTVITDEAGKALNDRNDYISILLSVLENFQCLNLHLAIITGMETSGVGSDDCIVPDII